MSDHTDEWPPLTPTIALALGAQRAPERREPARVPGAGALLGGRYRLLQELGRGATAAVYRGRDEVLHEPVAVKLLLPDGLFAGAAASESHDGIRGEAVAAMRLAHPNIVRVHTYERHHPWELLVMELVDGVDLIHWLRGRPLSRCTPFETIDVGLACLAALGYAHGRGVVHNDIKPANVLRTHDFELKICDFGLASVPTFVPSARRAAMGTPAYMSPERVRGEPGDARSDLYSLAAMLHALGEGTTLFGHGELAMRHHLDSPPPSSVHLPEPIGHVLHHALAKHRDHRFQCAGDMRDALLEARGALLR